MIGESFIINFIDNEAYLSDSKTLPLAQLAGFESIKKFNTSASMNLQIVKHSPSEKKIHAKIISYNTEPISFPDKQLEYAEILDTIEKIAFTGINTLELLRLKPEYLKRTDGEVHEIKSEFQNNILSAGLKAQKEPEIIEDSFTIPFSRFHFKKGCASFDKKIERLKRVVNFSISNEYIREEFESVKKYFIRALKIKKTTIRITIEHLNGQITNCRAYCEDVEKINSTLISEVRVSLLRKTVSRGSGTSTLLTSNDLMNTTLNKENKAPFVYENDTDILADLSKVLDKKHFKNLKFLSELRVIKLRFTLCPFSFIFIVESKKNYHVIWETLDTEEATYLWSYDTEMNELESVLKKTEEEIASIKSEGKMHYLHQSTGANLRRIFHDYSDGELGYQKWEKEIKSVLT